jgi:2-amino-4-hydroxy-6-hydroxymethyldihydropteridine diphosphokinase
MILIALGANLPSAAGAPQATLEAALRALEARGVDVCARSPWYRTPAFPPGSGPEYVNGAAKLAGPSSPETVLTELHAVEKSLGRSRGPRWGARVCDLDLLAFGDRVLPDEDTGREWIGLGELAQDRGAPERLTLPHPRLQDRAFVLIPLADIAPDWVHPVLGKSVTALLDRLPAEASAGIARI